MAESATEPDVPPSPRDEPASYPDNPASDVKWLRQDLSKEYYALLNVVSNYDGWLLVVKGWSVTVSLAALGLGFQQRHYALFGLAALTGAAFWYIDGLMKGFQYRYYVRMREIEYTAYLINRVRLGGLYREEEISAPRIDVTWGFKGFPVDDNLKELERSSPPLPRWRKRLSRLSKRWRERLSQFSKWWRRMLGLPEKLKRQRRHPKRAEQRVKQSKDPEDPDYRASEPWRREPEEIYWDLRRRFWWRNVMFPHVLAVVLGSLLFVVAAALNAAGVDHLRL